MRLLADSHTFLWFVEGNPQLSSEARCLLEDPNNEVLLSIASVWEMAIKVSIGKLTLLTPDKSFEVHLTEQLQQNGFGVLPIALSHIFLVVNLPFHHRDPFDRIISAQCLAEGIPIVSTDTVLDHYGVQRLW